MHRVGMPLGMQSALQSMSLKTNLNVNSIVIHDAQQQRWLQFQHPLAVFTASTLSEVMPLLETVQQRVEQQGCYAAGFFSYEAAPAFDCSLNVQPHGRFPLAWFGLYSHPQTMTLPAAPAPESLLLNWTPSISQQRYHEAIQTIKGLIAQGQTYQVNYSFRLRAAFNYDAWAYFLQLIQAQEGCYGAYINLEDWAICCASPELFFDWGDTRFAQASQRTITCRPMKGTAPRGLTVESDRHHATALRQSAKNQAENLMIVDMVRNDLGRIAEIGSVRVNQLFDVEQYPTLWQMTSPVQCTTDANLVEIFRALFPCASITGAPKPSTMQIITDLEDSPRQIYTGTIGFITPERTAQFNVAIRTVLVDKIAQTAEYGVGGGIVWDSVADAEYEECCTKAKILTQRRSPFSLLESMLWNPDHGYFLLDLHLQRLQDSAAYFAYLLPLDQIKTRLEAIAYRLPPQPHKVRLQVSRHGNIVVEANQIANPSRSLPLQIGIAQTPIDSSNVFLYHKTTYRPMYDQARQQYPDLDEVLLWNERGELTEFCAANLVVEQNGQWYTPPVECGLLGGTFRQWLLQQGTVQERVLLQSDLEHCSRIFLVNSVRQMQAAVVKVPLPLSEVV